MEQEKTQYRLYALSPTQKNVARACQERFSRVTPDYILLYAKESRPKECVELKDAGRLSGEDERWLLECNLAILAEETGKHRDKILRELNRRIDTLERVLREKAGETNGASCR